MATIRWHNCLSRRVHGVPARNSGSFLLFVAFEDLPAPLPPISAVCALKLTSISRRDLKFLMRARSSCTDTPISRIFHFDHYERSINTNILTAQVQGGVAARRAFTKALLNLDKRSLLGSMLKHCNGTNWKVTRTLHWMSSKGTDGICAILTMRLSALLCRYLSQL